MSAKLLRLWLLENAQRIELQETRVRADGLSRIAKPGGSYAHAMERLADAHHEAAAVYRRALAESEGQ